jgi:tetratricopeptide (TPR) repeat protein
MSNRILYLVLFFSIFNLGFSQDKLEELKPIIENYLETDLDSAEKYSEELLHSGYTNLNKEEEHHGLNYLAHIEYRRGNRMDALEFFIESLQIRYKHGKITETANTLNWIGRIHHEQTDYDKALEYYFLSLQTLQEEEPDSSYLLATLNNITYLYLDIGDNEKMLEYNNQSLIISKLTNDNLEYANACNFRGIYFQNLQTLDSAEIYYKKALAFYSEIDFTHKIAHQYNNLGIIYFLNGRMKDSYSNFLYAMNLRKALEDTLTYSESLRNLGDYFFYTENYDSSLYYYNNSLKLALEVDSKNDVKEIYECLSELHYDLKDYKKAYEFHLQYSELHEDIFSLNQFDKLHEMEAKFQFQNQREQLEIIMDSNKKLKEINEDLESEKANSIIGYYIFIVISCILIVVTFFQFKRKNKSE